MKAYATAASAFKVRRGANGLLWGLFFLAKGLAGTLILILAVFATAIAYVLALPLVLFHNHKRII